MKVAVGCNACPFCGEPIMNEKRHGQMLELDRVLANARFTNTESIDIKLKEKVITLMLEHFEFKRITSSLSEEDVIVIDNTEEVPPPPSPPQGPKPINMREAQIPPAPPVPVEQTPAEEPATTTLSDKVREAKKQAAETKVDEAEVQKLLKGYEKLIGGMDDLPDPDTAQIDAVLAGGSSTAQQVERMKAKHLDTVGTTERGDNRSIRRAE